MVCRNAQFGDLTKNHTYNYTSTILTSGIPKICLSHFQHSKNQHGIRGIKSAQKQNDSSLCVWRTSFLCLILLCFQAREATLPHLAETNRKAVNSPNVVWYVVFAAAK